MFRAVSELTALIAADHNNIEAARQLAALLQKIGIDNPRQLEPVYARIVAIDPYDVEAHATLDV